MDIGTVHLLEASIKLECSIEVTARGLLLYHHFMRCAAEIRYDVDMVAAGALSLSARLYEQPIDQDSLICVFYSIVNQTHDVMSSEDVAYGLIKKTLIRVDFMMIRLLEFDLNHRVAHQYLVPFLKMIFERSKYIADFRAELGRTCIRFMSDFYTQQICLEFSPELIAIASIDLALYVHGLLNDLDMIPAWYMGFACDVTPDRVKIIKRIILNLYEKFFIITQAQLIPVQAQQVVSTHPKQIAPTQVQVVPPQAQQVVSTHPKQIAPTQVQVVPPQAQQIQFIESHMRQVVQCHAQQIVSHQVRQALPAEVIQVEDMDISP